MSQYSNGFTPPKNFKPKPPKPVTADVYYATAILADDDTPTSVVAQMVELADMAAEKGFSIRCSPINEAGKAINVGSKREPVVPWNGFADADGLYKPSKQAKLIAMRFQPNLSKLKPSIHAIVGHLVSLVIGEENDSYIRCLICYTPDGAESLADKTSRTGRLGIAVALAGWLNIPIFNLRNPDGYQRAKQYLSLYKRPFQEGEWDPALVAFKMKEV